jgi:hypothetical protein
MNVVSSMPKPLRTALWLVLIKLWKSETYSKPSFRAAKCVPATRAWILAKAVSRAVEVSSPNGENPQSSVVPSWFKEMYSAASRIRSLISSGVSILGLIGSVTPTKTV